MTAIRLAVLICVTSLLNGCILLMLADRSAPLKSWEHYYKKRKHDTPFEVVQVDMLHCGFDNPRNTSELFNKDLDQHITAEICMENKGYHKIVLPKGVCHRYPDSSPCQARQKNPK